jgi:peroxiredoxin
MFYRLPYLLLRWLRNVMPHSQSTLLPPGAAAPDFHLPDVTTGEIVTLDRFAGSQALLVMFLCRHCPYVQHIQGELARLGRDYAARPLGIVAIASNDAEAYPEDAPASLREMAATLGFSFPFCYDASQDVARAYMAECTPEFFLFDSARKLAYHGQFDDSRPRRGSNPTTGPPTGKDLRAAIDALLEGRAVSSSQKPGVGCSIKWRVNTASA